MKKFLFFLLTAILMLPLFTQAQDIEIGTGTTTSYTSPFNNLYKNSWNECIYLASEIQAAGSITEIAYYYGGTATSTYTYTTLKVYMGTTTRSEISSTTNWTPANDLTLVYDGTNIVNPTTQGWFTITLDNPFNYNGTDNLVVVVSKTVSSYNSSFTYRYTSTSSNYRCMYRQSDSDLSYAQHPGSNTGTRTYNRANIKLTLGNVQCPTPKHPTVSNITTTDADFSWTTGDHETDWEVFIDETVIPDSNTIGTAVTDTFYTFTGLNSNTAYSAYVRANCLDSNAYSPWVRKDFRTACDNITTLPYTDNFDTYGTGTTVYPPCWYKINTYTSGDRPYINSTHYEGTGSMYFYTGTSGTYNIAITSLFDASIPINTLQANFMYRANSTTDRLIVGVMDDPTDASTFVAIETIQPESSATTWVERTVSFDSYTGTGQYIAFKNEYTSTTAYGYIDNLVIDNIPTCVKPTLVHTSNVTATTVDVSWTAPDDQYIWEVVVVPTGTDVTNGIPESASTNPYTVTGLDDQTTYDVYVRANCGSEYSSWSFPAHFTTDPFCTHPLNVTVNQITGTSAMVSWNPAQYGALSYTVEYSESGLYNWNMQTVDGTQYMISGLQPNTDYEVMVYSNCDLGTADTINRSFTTHCLSGGDPFTEGTSTAYTIPLNNYYNYSYTQQIYLASEMGGASTIDSIAFEYAYSTASTDKTNVVIYLGHTSQSTFSGSSNYIPSTNLQQVYSGPMNCQQGWNTFVFSTPFQYNGTDNLVLVVDDNSGDYDGNSYVFNVHNAGATRTLYFYSDSYNPAPSNPTSAGASSSTTSNRSNVKFFIPCDNTATCIAPNVFVTEVSSESVTLDWAPGLSESSWELEYSTDNSTWTSMGSVSTHPYELTGLDANTNYYIHLRSDCGSEYSDWVSVSARTACTSVDVPYTENFDDAPASGSGNMVYCWTRGTNNTSTAYPYTSSGQHHSGTYSAYFYGASSYYSYIASPLFDDNVQMDNLQVRFWAYKTSAAYYIQVGIMEDPNDYSTFVQVGQDITPSATSTWELFEVNTDNYTGTGRYIAFRIPMGTASYMYIDDIDIDYIPLCAHVTNIHTVANSVTANAADIEWTAGGDETEWQVVYGPAGSIADPDLETADNVYTPEISLTGLSGSTLYDVYVKAVCSSGNSIWMQYSFRTACGEISAFPFSENFDNMGTGSSVYPNCWARSNTYSTSTNYPYVSSSYHTSGNASLYFYCSTSTYNLAILPPVDVTTHPVNTLMVSFMMRSTSSITSQITVGVMTDPTNPSTFTPVEAFHNTATGTFEYMEAMLSPYTGSGQYIALKLTNTSSTYSVYIDDLTVDLIPGCPRPRNVVFGNITSEGADVNWTPYGTESAWEVVVVPAGHPISEGTPEYTTSRPLSLTGLDDETAYDVYVRADCDGGDYSDWSIASTFTTTPLCSSPANVTVTQIAGTSALVSWDAALYGANSYTIEYTVADQSSWTMETASGTEFMLSYLDPSTTYTVQVTSNCDNGTASPVQTTFTTGCLSGGAYQIGNGTSTTSYFPEYCLYNYSYTQQIYLASELNGAVEISSIAFEAQSIENANRHLKIYLMHTTAASSAWLNASTATLVYDATPTLVEGWNTFNFTTPFQYNGTDNLAVIVIDATGSWSGTNDFYCHTTSQELAHYEYQDDDPYSINTIPDGSGTSSTSTSRNNVRFGMPCDDNATCVAPNAYIAEVTSESITVNWAPGYTENAWEMEYSTDQTNWTSLGSVTAPYDLDNLNADTRYYIRIHSDCGSEYSNWITLDARTACSDITVPYMQNFDDAPASGSGNMVTCWTRNTNYTSTAYPYTSSSQHHSGGYSVYFYGTSTYYSYLASPRFADEVDMDNLQISFWAYKTSAAYNIQVGIMSDPEDYNTFVQIGQTLSPTATSTWELFEVNTDSYMGNGRYVAFRIPANITSYMYIDDINIDNIPSCSHVTDIHTVGAVTTTAADITWTAGGSETEWEVVYGEAGTITNPETETPETAYTNSIQLTNLTGNTAYDVYIRAACSDGGYSTWLQYTFRTACDEITTLPYVDNFDTYGTGTTVYPPCWYKINTYTSADRPYINATHYAGTGSMYFYAGSSGTYNTAITPLFDASIPINTLQATFMYKASNSSDRLIVGVMSSPTDASTFVPVDTVYPDSPVSTWVEREVTFSQYTGTGQYIAFKNEYTTTSAYGYIDELSIDLIPSCPKPQHIHVVDATINSIELGWTEVGSATSWEIAYGAPGFDPDGTEASYVTATSNPFTISNLNNSTTYEFYVRALCNSTDISYWSNSVSAATTMVPTDLPYTADFSDPNDAWVLNNGSCPNYWMRGTVNNDPALFVTSNGSTPEYTNSATSVAALKLFTVGTVDSITISFDIMVDGEGNYDYFKLFLAPASQQFPASTTAPGSGDYGYNDYSINAYNFYANGYGTQSSHPYILNKLTAGIHVTATMPNPNTTPNATSTALLALAWKNDGSVLYNPPATITNLTVTAGGSGPVITDPTVTTNAASAITQNSATLNATITNPSGVTITTKGFEWKLTNGGTYTQIAGIGTGNSFSANLTGLTANTSYTFKAFITFNGTTVYGNEMTFTTQNGGGENCNVPANVTTANVTYNAADVNWTAGGSETSWNLQYKAASASNWGNSIAVNATTYHISGLNAETAYQVRVQANCGNGNTSDWTAPVSFTTATEPAEPCDAPTALQVDNITQTTATLTWTPGGNEASWKVSYKLNSSTQWQEVNVQQPTYELEGLTAETAYDVRVKAVCSANNESDFATASFSTLPVGIDNITLTNSISLTPNPADNYIELNVNSNVVEVTEAVIYNAFGQMVQTVQLTDNHARIELSNMASGMYFVRVNGEGVTATKKFIKR